MVSVLWWKSVAAEVLVFFLLGPALVTWLTRRRGRWSSPPWPTWCAGR